MAKRCTACGQAPSGLIPREHDFCEHCGAALTTEAPEQVTLTCYRCGKKFEAQKGATICADCQQTPAGPATEVPSPPEKSYAMAAFSGVAFPIVVRIAFAMMVVDSASREVKALIGVFAFLAACVVMVLVGLIAWTAGQRSHPPSSIDQAITLAAGVITTVLLWQLT